MGKREVQKKLTAQLKNETSLLARFMNVGKVPGSLLVQGGRVSQGKCEIRNINFDKKDIKRAFFAELVHIRQADR